VATLPDDVRATVTKFLRQLNANDIPMLQAYVVFGSYAKGRQTEWSDIDLALVSDKFEGNLYYDRCKIIPYSIPRLGTWFANLNTAARNHRHPPAIRITLL
jgi:hypothetical protein